MSYILALDQGTTSSRAILFDREGTIRAVTQREFRQIFPKPGWVEHDAEEIWETQWAVATEALARAGIGARDVAAVGITNQRETTVVWDRATGAPIGNAIVWQDRRTAEDCEQMSADGLGEMIRERTGLVLDAYFSGTKLAWLLDHTPGARERARRGELAFGTIDSWLIWRLTGGARHVTDATNASRTMLFNIARGEWDEELLALFGVPLGMLPEVCVSSGVLGECTLDGLRGVPIAGIAGDQQAALFGQGCTRAGMAKNTYGTGCFLLMHTGEERAVSRHRLLTTAAASLGRAREFALEGSVFIAGAAVQWLRDGLGIIRDSSEVEALAKSVPDSDGVHFIPAFSGLGAPHWDPHARGMIEGLTRGSTAAHIARAALESIAFQTADVLDAMRGDARVPLTELRVDGGAAANDLLMQFQADIAGVPVLRPAITETTALGAARLAGLGVGFWKDAAELESQWSVERRFEPAMTRSERDDRLSKWRAAVKRAKSERRAPAA